MVDIIMKSPKETKTLVRSLSLDPDNLLFNRQPRKGFLRQNTDKQIVLYDANAEQVGLVYSQDYRPFGAAAVLSMRIMEDNKVIAILRAAVVGKL